MTKIFSAEALRIICDSHAAWLRGEEGQRASLTMANLTRANLTRANLTMANLAGANLTRANLTEASLAGADLAGANLTRANLTRADLAGANLTRANLAGAQGLPLAPAVANLDAQILQRITAVPHSLQMRSWHGDCGTTHCRAGWAITLAGASGAALEKSYGPNVAGALIYAASYPESPVPDFFATNEETLQDMHKRADDVHKREAPHAC